MSANIKVKVVDISKKKPLEGAKVTVINHSAWDSKKKIYGSKKTGSDGTVSFEKIDTGVFGGDFYQFKVEYTIDGKIFSKDVYKNIYSKIDKISIGLDIEHEPEAIDKKLSDLEERLYNNMSASSIISRYQEEKAIEDLRKDLEKLKKEFYEYMNRHL